jgi:hypothetical protein
MLQDSAVVLRSEAIAEGRSLGFAVLKIRGDGDDNNNDEYNCSNDELGIREVIEHCVLLCGISATAKVEWESLRRRGRNLRRIHHGRPFA